MAEFIQIDKNKYKIVGILNENDINLINSFKNRTTLILDNTVGLSSELVSRIESDRVVFSIKGGLDYDTKEKYKTQKYVDRTFVSSSGLKKIIDYFEYNENLIDPNWNEFEKAMFLYNALVVDMECGEDYEKIQSAGTTERSLNGILYGKLICAGFAQVYKEMLDRVGIKNYYQNQKDVHSFNIIEIDNKKYGVDVTWDNVSKKDYDGKCGFGRFGHDPEFYSRHGHQLYREEALFDPGEERTTRKVYDTDEEVYDLDLLNMDQLNKYYSHIASKVNSRRTFRYDLQDQPLEIKNKYLPVDTVDLRLKQEASQDYSIIVILNFLKNRNALKIDSQLLEAFSSRKGYLLDMSANYNKRGENMNLSLIDMENYKIEEGGNVIFNNGKECRKNIIHGIELSELNISQEELNIIYDKLNQYLNQYFNKYIFENINNLDTLLDKYEYKPDEWDEDRAIESANIHTKLALIVGSRDYLIQSGMNEEEVNNITQKIMNKHKEIHMPYEHNASQSEIDLDFLSEVFGNLDMIRETIEYDLQKQISENEFISLCHNVDYIISLFEKYVIIAGEKKFKFSDYNVSKEELQQLLNKLLQEYQIMNDEASYVEDTSSFGIRR